MKLPSFPQLLIFLDIVAISVLIHLNRIGVIGGLGYLIGLLGTAILFAFLVKLAREDEEKNQRGSEMKLSKKRRLILTIIVLVVLYPTFCMRRRMSMLYCIADRECVFKFMTFELRHFGGRAVTDVIELPPQVVPVYSLEDFEKFRELCGGPTVYTMMRPTRADEPEHFSDNKRTLRTTYFRTYYFFNNAGTIAWEYTHTIKFKVQLRGED